MSLSVRERAEGFQLSTGQTVNFTISERAEGFQQKVAQS
jgi:hypothetical protein